MQRPTAQRMLHWLEDGDGKAVVQWIAAAAVVLVFSVYFANRRLTGPGSEVTTMELVAARQNAAGQFFTTQVLHPQALAVLETRGLDGEYVQPTTAVTPEGRSGAHTPGRIPELYRPPFYPLVLGGALALAQNFDPEGALYRAPAPNSRAEEWQFAADVVLTWFNVLLLWGVVVLAGLLAGRLFGPWAALVAGAAAFFNWGLWESVLLLRGGVLLALLLLALFHVWLSLDRARTDDPAKPEGALWPLWAALAGLLAGLCFLTEYAVGWLLPVLLGYGAVAFRGRAMAAVLVAALAAFALVAGPWIARNLALTGHPLALAGQDLALASGDATAEPLEFRHAYAPAGPEFSAAKVINKGLRGLQADLGGGLWKGGGYLWMALTLLSALHFYREPEAQTLRWLALIAAALLVGLTPFLDSGEQARPPATYLAPLFCVFGAGFLIVLVEGLRRRAGWQKALAVVAALAFSAFPLVQPTLAPATFVRFQFPPYYPGVMSLVAGNFSQFPGHPMIVADLPAGTAWYSHRAVAGLPADLEQLRALDATQEGPGPTDGPRRGGVVAVLLTPRTLHRAYLSTVFAAARPPEVGTWEQVLLQLPQVAQIHWRDVAGGATARRQRSYPLVASGNFPFPHVLMLGNDHVVLLPFPLP